MDTYAEALEIIENGSDIDIERHHLKAVIERVRECEATISTLRKLLEEARRVTGDLFTHLDDIYDVDEESSTGCKREIPYSGAGFDMQALKTIKNRIENTLATTWPEKAGR